jgi:hypothetical protein
VPELFSAIHLSNDVRCSGWIWIRAGWSGG